MRQAESPRWEPRKSQTTHGALCGRCARCSLPNPTENYDRNVFFRRSRIPLSHWTRVSSLSNYFIVCSSATDILDTIIREIVDRTFQKFQRSNRVHQGRIKLCPVLLFLLAVKPRNPFDRAKINFLYNKRDNKVFTFTTETRERKINTTDNEELPGMVSGVAATLLPATCRPVVLRRKLSTFICTSPRNRT